MAEKAQNEADASDLGVFSRPSSSTPYHRPSHSGVHRHHKPHHHGGSHHPGVSHHHGTSHHHGESQHCGEFQDFPDNAFSPHSPHSRRSHHHHSSNRDEAHQSTSLAHGTVLPHHSYDEDFDDDHHHSSRRHHDGEACHRDAPHHYDAYNDRGPNHQQAHHHRRPLHPGETYSHNSYERSDHHGIPRFHRNHQSKHHRGHHGEQHPREYHHSAQRHDYLPSGHRYGEHHHDGSHALDPHKSLNVVRVSPAYSRATVRQPSVAFNFTRSPSAVRSHASQGYGKVLQNFSSRPLGSWGEEDEQYQKCKASRTQRAHRKSHSVGFFSLLLEKLCHLLQGFRKMLRKLTGSLVFEAFIFLVVCLNTIMLVAQTFAEVEVRGEWYFMALDSIFLCIYVVEAMLKIIAMGFKYFSDPWNNLDFFIMVMAVLDFMLMQINSNSLKLTVYNQSVVRIFKVFKSLRALRAIRVLRRLSFLTSLQEVTGTLVRSLPSITAILILMFTCLFLFSVVLRALFRQSDPKRFQNIFTTIFTLFTLLTLDDWSNIYLDSRAQGAWYIIPILMIYIIIQYFIFLNLVIAVLVDNFQMALLQGLEKVKQEKAARIQEKLLDDSLTKLSKADSEEVMSEHTKYKYLIEKKFGTMTEKQQGLLFHFLQLVAGVEHYQQKFRSQASVIDEIVDTAFEAGEEDFRR